jgi:hypothetical protein
MNRTLVCPLAFALALVPAAAGASKPSEALGLTAAPARLVFHGSGATTVRLRNPGRPAWRSRSAQLASHWTYMVGRAS